MGTAWEHGCGEVGAALKVKDVLAVLVVRMHDDETGWGGKRPKHWSLSRHYDFIVAVIMVMLARRRWEMSVANSQ